MEISLQKLLFGTFVRFLSFINFGFKTKIVEKNREEYVQPNGR
jgi:hypothetical protein